MTHTMIWTFGSIGAFLLLILVSKIGSGGSHYAGQYRRIADKSQENQEATNHRLDQIGAQLGELQIQLAAMERILKEVE